jgi:hypothetical protein
VCFGLNASERDGAGTLEGLWGVRLRADCLYLPRADRDSGAPAEVDSIKDNLCEAHERRTPERGTKARGGNALEGLTPRECPGGLSAPGAAGRGRSPGAAAGAAVPRSLLRRYHAPEKRHVGPFRRKRQNTLPRRDAPKGRIPGALRASADAREGSRGVSRQEGIQTLKTERRQ